jgi:putative toxin-antitoxin system antitoxin component (TIGR02293 family)
MAQSRARRLVRRSSDPVAAALGGRPVLGASGTSPLALVPVIRKGLDWRALEAAARYVGASVEELAAALGLARRTLDRRKVEGRLDPEASERVVRLARVAARAREVLGDADEMRRWLRAPNRALGMEAPITLLDTDLGTVTVLDVLGRLEHGVFS